MLCTASARAAAVLITVASLLLAGALGARAASRSGWSLSVTRHYGAPDHASGYSAVVTAGPADVWALGGTNPGGDSVPAALRWNGTRWQSWPLPPGLTGFIGDASATSARDIWAVSYAGGYALHWNGTRWAVAKRWRQQDVLTSVTALSPADVWVFGTGTDGSRGMGTWHFTGRTWAPVPGRAAQIYRASAVSATDIWAVADARQGGSVERYDGHAWRPVTTGRALGHATLDDVLAVSRSSVWVVGNLHERDGEGHLIIGHFDGHRWTRTLTSWHADTGRLAPDGSGGVWVTADAAGAKTEVLIGRLTLAGKFTWSTLRQGLGSGVSNIAAGRGARTLWLSGGFLTQAGGDAAVWSRAGGTPHPRARRAAGPDVQTRALGPLVIRSGHLNLMVVLRLAEPPALA